MIRPATTSSLSAIGSRSLPRFEVSPVRRAQRPSNQSVAIPSDEDRGRPVVVVGEVPGEQHDHDRDGDRAREGQLVRRNPCWDRIRGRWRRSRKSSSRTGARSRSGSSARCASSGSRRWRSTRRPDRDSLHAAAADEAYLIGPGRAGRELPRPGADARGRRRGRRGGRSIPATASWRRTPCFARAVAEAGLVWIGPPPEAIEAMGSKIGCAGADGARPGVPIVPGTTEPIETGRRARTARRRVRLAARDQGVRGRRRQGAQGRRGRPTRPSGRSRRRGARARPTSPTRPSTSRSYVEDPRHVEVQVLADAHGNVVHLGERDCTIQRRHQKLVEETPSPAVEAGAARADRRRSPSTRRVRSATEARARSRVCSTATATTGSSR